MQPEDLKFDFLKAIIARYVQCSQNFYVFQLGKDPVREFENQHSIVCQTAFPFQINLPPSSLLSASGGQYKWTILGASGSVYSNGKLGGEWDSVHYSGSVSSELLRKGDSRDSEAAPRLPFHHDSIFQGFLVSSPSVPQKRQQPLDISPFLPTSLHH